MSPATTSLTVAKRNIIKMIEQSLEEQIVSKLNSKTGSGEYILEASEYDDLALFIEDWISWLS